MHTTTILASLFSLLLIACQGGYEHSPGRNEVTVAGPTGGGPASGAMRPGRHQLHLTYRDFDKRVTLNTMVEVRGTRVSVKILTDKTLQKAAEGRPLAEGDDTIEGQVDRGRFSATLTDKQGYLIRYQGRVQEDGDVTGTWSVRRGGQTIGRGSFELQRK